MNETSITVTNVSTESAEPRPMIPLLTSVCCAFSESVSVPFVPFVRTYGRSNTRSASSVRKRSEEHTSELQSRGHLVCRLLLEKKKRQPSQGRSSDGVG